MKFLKGKFCWLFDQTERVPVDFRAAINVGNTITTRFWIALISLTLAAQLWSGQPSIFSHPNYLVFLQTFPMQWWVGLLGVSGLLMLWRVMAIVPRPVWGWASNVLTFFAWMMVVVSRIAIIGWNSLPSWCSIVCIMAAWVLVRTESTRRDGETA